MNQGPRNGVAIMLNPVDMKQNSFTSLNANTNIDLSGTTLSTTTDTSSCNSSNQCSVYANSTNGTESITSSSSLTSASSSPFSSNIKTLPTKISSLDEYQELYRLSIEQPDIFWKLAAERLHWFKFPTIIKNTSFDYLSDKGVSIKWYEDGILNVCYNCLDINNKRHLSIFQRHIEQDSLVAMQNAFIFEPDQLNGTVKYLTYGELLEQVKKFANVLKRHGVKKGDRVTIYLPMILEACIALFACARIGAVHSVVFAGFSAHNLAERIDDCKSSIIITSDFSYRGNKCTPLKSKTDQALKQEQCSQVKTVIVVNRGYDKTENALSVPAIEWVDGRDHWYHEEMANASNVCPPEPMNAEDPLFILYTSGSTGKPKGILHTTGGYLVYVSLTFQYVFAYNPGDIYMCTADVGWITGHSYVVYGPLSNRATSIVFEGVPTYPDVSRFWQIVDKYQVNIFYTAPTAIRSLMTHSDGFVTKTSRKSLRILGTVGEPINPEAWRWYHRVVGNEKCPIVDTWWQTETGGFMITPIPYVTELEAGSATLPFFGIQTQIMDKETRNLLIPPCKGELCIKDSWPGQARSLYNDHKRFVEVYFKGYRGFYFTGDGCEVKENGYHWITGRVDDVLVISGHNIGTAEVESALVLHPAVSEAAVVGYPDPKKNQGMYCFVTLKDDQKESDELKKELITSVKEYIGAHVYPDVIHFTPNLPKTRSGKIMRRILRKIAEPDIENLGDTSTLTDPAVVDELINTCLRSRHR
ncbi:unnamed protein product [Didymodactylos carnosus]|uniref:Acetyl-coenzyme A synthetase n=1 Tax=Didymodactylos carnosus TaxID=1234261 RepID=A0A8S2KL32_9BILA|nr:unnamed protein product [Didymodactylos carnosus]CAF3846097.1 unnamed protein product [Didymodactylos carnosus]